MQPSDRRPPGEAAEQYSGDTSDPVSRAVHSDSVFGFPYQRRGCPCAGYLWHLSKKGMVFITSIPSSTSSFEYLSCGYGVIIRSCFP